MEPTRESVIDMIQRLFALSASPNEFEAKLALAKAQELLLKYNLNMEEIADSPIDKKDWTELEIWQGNRLSWESNFVTGILDKYFFVKCIIHRSRHSRQLCIFGNRENVEIAKHIYHYLSRVFRALWQQYRKDNQLGKGYARTYYNGLYAGFCDKLKAERKIQVNTVKSQNTLVVVTNVLVKSFKDKYPETRKVQSAPIRGDSIIQSDGYNHGKAINLHSAIPSKNNLILI